MHSYGAHTLKDSGTERTIMRLFSRKHAGQTSDRGSGARKKPRRLLRIAGIAALIALGLTLASTAINLLLERAEKSSIPPLR